MTLTLAEPVWMLLLALAAPLGWLLVRWARGLPLLRRWIAAGLRVCLLGVLALLMALPSTVRRTDRLAVVAVLDVSESVDRFGRTVPDEDGRPQSVSAAVERALRRLDAGRGPEDLLGLVVFGGRPLVLATPGPASLNDRAIDTVIAGGTDIGSALSLAAALVPPDAAGRIVLISDGNQTAGDASEAAGRLAATAAGGSLRIDAVPIDYALQGETIVEAVLTPSSAPADALVPVRVEIASTNGARGVLRLFEDDAPVDLEPDDPETSRRLELGPGRHVVLLDAPLADRRLTRFKAVFEPEALAPGTFAGDTHLDNNAAESFTLSPGQGSVLILGGPESGPSTGHLAAALRGDARRVQTADPSAAPTDLLELQEYDLVLLNNVPADALGDAAQNALALHVARTGAGLIMVGGRSSFGTGGWAGTPIEPLLPVHLDLPERLVERRSAIVFVLDASGSMGANVGGTFRSQQQIANEAAAAAVASLGPVDLVGVVAFSNDARWVVPLAENDNAPATALSIAAIAPGGGTNLPPALDLARQALEPVQAAVKHVIVLSDGRSRGAESLPDQAQGLAQAGINVSTITIGDGADTDTMFAVAQRGGGVHYPVTNPNVLPKVFVRAVRIVRDPLIKEGEFTPVVLPSVSQVPEGLGPLPPLLGVTLTRFREDPTAVNALATPDGEPLLAHWNAELGRVAAFTSDADAWAQPWLDAPTFAAFWTRLAAAIARPAAPQGLELTTSIDDGSFRVRLLALDDKNRSIDGLDVPATLYAPDGTRTEIQLEQVNPGEYEASLPVAAVGSHIAIVRPARDGSPLPPVLGGATLTSTAEYRALSPDTGLLQNIAQLGGGEIIPLAGLAEADLFSRERTTPRRAESPLHGPLLVAALVLLLLDIAARRVAWDRFLAERSPRVSVGATPGLAAATLRAKVKAVAVPESRAARLGEADAAEVARAARRQRAAAKRPNIEQPTPAESPAPSEAAPAAAAPIAPKPTTPKPVAPTPAESQEPESGLLAAKRRARERFDQ